MSTKWIALIASIGLLVGISACTPRSPEKRLEGMVSHLSRKLDLNDEQKAKLNGVKEVMLEVRRANQDENKQHLAELKQILSSDKLDSARVKALMSKKHKMMESGFDKVYPKLNEFHVSLTPEQRKKGIEMIEKMAEHWQ